MEPRLLHDVTDSVATVVIHHPGKRNAMTAEMWRAPPAPVATPPPGKRTAMPAEMWRALPPLLDTLAADPAVRALVLTGEGGTFCAGADISTLRAEPSAAQALSVLAEEALAAFPKPTVA